jgi:GH15 family glucan-1,4-alpha-glucosidase
VARVFLIGNGSLTATGDGSGTLHELFAPSLSPETQLLRRPARIGLAVDGILRWLPDRFEARACEPGDAPIADVSLVDAELEIELWIESYVDARLPVLVRRVQVSNRGPVHRALTLYFHHDFRLAAGRPHESARRDPESGGLLHASGRRAILFNLEGPEGAGVSLARLSSRLAEEGPGADAEALEGGAKPRSEAAGYVDSVGGVSFSLGSGESILVTASLACGSTPEEARAIDATLRRDGLPASLTRTRGHWTLWSNEGSRDFADLPELVGAVFASSLLALRLHQTPEGAIVSGVEESGDAAGTGVELRWCWLADASLAADSLGRAGYSGAARRYFTFVAEAARRSGRLAAAYEPTGDAVTLPNEPEVALLGTALHLWAAARHFERDRDIEFISPMWEPLLVPTAERLAGSLEASLGLPRSSDWWNERIGFHAPTAGAVRGALRGAARMAALLGEASRARAWSAAADRIARAMASTLMGGISGTFARGLKAVGGGWLRDETADASLLLLGLLDDFEPEDPRVRATVAEVRERLWVRTGTGGMARYERDPVGSVGGDVSDEGTIPGCPNVAATLWLALHSIRAARRLQDMEPGRTLLFWAAARAEGVGLLPERLHPHRGRTTGPTPSLRAHAWYVQAAVDYSERVRLLTRCERCGEPSPARHARRRAVAAATRVASLPGVVADL